VQGADACVVGLALSASAGAETLAVTAVKSSTARTCVQF
jgi:hypothetical protein